MSFARLSLVAFNIVNGAVVAHERPRLSVIRVANLAPEGLQVDVALVVHDQARALGENSAAWNARLFVDEQAFEMSLAATAFAFLNLILLIRVTGKNSEAGIRLAIPHRHRRRLVGLLIA